MPLLHQNQRQGPTAVLIPPLDVQWAWFVHRLNPTKYVQDCVARFGTAVHPSDWQEALGFSAGGQPQAQSGANGVQPTGQDIAAARAGDSFHGRVEWAGNGQDPGQYTRKVWEAAYPAGQRQPLEHCFWPPAPPPSRPPLSSPPQSAGQHPARKPPQLASGEAQLGGGPEGATAVLPACGSGPAADDALSAAAGPDSRAGPAPAAPCPAPGSLDSVRSYVVDAMPRQGTFLHQVLRAPYQDAAFLAAARQRYFRFLALIRTRQPGAPLLVPMYDIDLMWHTHLALSGAYGADCDALMPPGMRPLHHDDTMVGASLHDPFLATLTRYEAEIGLMYNVAPSRRIPWTVAHPLTTHVWPLAVVLSKAPPVASAAAPLGPLLPTPRELEAHLTGTAGAGARSKGKAKGKAEDGGKDQQREGGGGDGDGAEGTAEGSSCSWRQLRGMMYGCPDHLQRTGVFAMYGLWTLAAALPTGAHGGGAAAGGANSVGAPGSCTEHGGRGQAIMTADMGSGRVAASRPTGLRRLLGPCLGAQSGGGGSSSASARAFGGVGRSVVEAAVSHMTSQLLRLADAADPTSPLATHQHPFWADLFPLPPPPLAAAHTHTTATATSPPATPVPTPGIAANDAAADAGSRYTDTAAPNASSGADAKPKSGVPTRSPPRLPAPPPSLDLPASYIQPPSSRDVASVYLAPHHYGTRAPVLYTPSDLCVLGPGRWCLPPALAADLLPPDPEELQAQQAAAAAARADDLAAGDVGGMAARRRQRAVASEAAVAAAAELEDRVRGANPLGLVVHSPEWRHLLLQSYRRLYERMGPGGVSGQA